MERETECPTAKVSLTRLADLTVYDHAEVQALREAVYSPAAFETWPGRHVEWSSPEWCVRVRDESNALVSFIGVYRRAALCDGYQVLIGGIGNVKTHPAAPAAASPGWASTARWSSSAKSRPWISPYSSANRRSLTTIRMLGWRLFAGRLLVTQHGSPAEFTLNRVMTRSIRTNSPSSGTIDLAGPPW